MDRRAHPPLGWQAIVVLGLCFIAASVYGLGSGRARLTVIPARPTDRAFLVRAWGELRQVTELPTLLIEPRPFVMELRPIPAYGPEPQLWGLSVARTTAAPRPPEAEASLEPARPVMANTPSVSAPELPAPSTPADAPDPALVREVMASFRGRAERCYEATMVPGRVELLLTVEGATGSVLTARAAGESPIARCIERAASSLRFPIFARTTISIQQTYAFR